MALFLPELALLGIVLVLCCLSLKTKPLSENSMSGLLAFGGLVVLALSIFTLTRSGTLFFGTYRVDLFSQSFKIMLALAYLATLLLSQNMISVAQNRRVEYGLFMTSAVLGMMMMTSAVDILTLYVSLELSSYSLYLLSALRKGRQNAESSVKYLLFGGATSGLFLWGISLLAGLSGSTSLLEICAAAPTLISQPAFLVAIFLTSLGLLFKLSAFPMHFWAPDVYESAATPIVNFIATASKAAAVALLIRVFMSVGVPAPLVTILGVLAFASMTLGNAVALAQRDVKRLLAYSSVAQAGYLLVGLLSGSREGYASSLFYAFAYLVMNTGAFLVTVIVAKAASNDNPKLNHFDGLAERSPLLALLLLLSVLSLAGIPPLVGFTGKWILFLAAMQKGHWFLVLWGVLNSVVSLFYYLTLVKHAYLEKPKKSDPLAIPFGLSGLAICLIILLVVLGFYPGPVITLAQTAIHLSLQV